LRGTEKHVEGAIDDGSNGEGCCEDSRGWSSHGVQSLDVDTVEVREVRSNTPREAQVAKG
jgi:hypothetical protein